VAHNRLTADKVLICLLRHPYRHVIRRWNWKSACLSAFLRGILILLVNRSSGGAGAIGAMFAEICYRALTSGFYSSIVQSFRYVQPVWTATLVSMVLLPMISDTVEFTVHILRGTPRIGATITASAIFTVAATLIELFAMRHGILIVGQNSNSLLQDVRKLPGLILELFSNSLRLISAAFTSAQKKEIHKTLDGYNPRHSGSAPKLRRPADSPVEL
jgi:hypothetical protein